MRFNIPILNAYSIEYFIFHEWALNSTIPNNDSNIWKTKIIDWKELVLDTNFKNFEDWLFAVTIFYHWVRSYPELFYWVENSKQKIRLWQYYKEAEKNFKTRSYLSFMLMCWAIFEWILEAKGINWRFHEKIAKAYLDKLIGEETEIIMNKIREKRNVVHLNNFDTYDYPSTTDFMDTRKELDYLILYFND